MKALFRFNISLLLKGGLFIGLILGALVAFAPVESGLQPNYNDKVLHFVGFFILSFAFHLAYPYHPFRWSVAGLVVYGTAIEIVQGFIPYREFSLLDFLANLAGVLTYFLLLAPLVTQYFIAKIYRIKNTSES